MGWVAAERSCFESFGLLMEEVRDFGRNEVGDARLDLHP